MLFVQPRERRLLGIIEKDTKQKLNSWEKPSAKQMAEQRKTKLAEVLAAKLETNLPSVYHQWVEELCQKLELPAQQLAAALLSEQFSLQHLLPPPQTKKPRREKPPRNDRGDRTERASRTERGERKPRKPRREDNIALEKYRIEAGHDHGVQPKDIVGALANEAGIDREYIGRIELNDDHSLVGLPPGMPKDIFQLLQKVRVKGQPMRLSRAQAGNSDQPRPTKQARNSSTRKKPDTKARSRKPKAKAKATDNDRPRRKKPAAKKKPQS